MKNQKIYLAVIIMLSFTLFSFQCTRKAVAEGDIDGPEITVVSPSELSQFYIAGGEDTPDSILIYATVTDDSGINIGTIRIFNNAGDEIFNNAGYELGNTYPYSVYPTSFNSYRVNHIQIGFSTLIPDSYRIEIEFRDDLGNSSIVTRNVVCLDSAIGGTDG